MSFIAIRTGRDQRPMLVNVDHIQTVVQEFLPIEGQAAPEEVTKVVMRDGESGYCMETVSEIHELIKDAENPRRWRAV